MTCAKHISKFADLLSIFNRLIKRLCEVVAYKDCKVRVFTLFILKAVSVYNSKVVIVVFLRNKAAWILAESTYFILPRSRITDKLRFVKRLVYFFHNFVSALNPYADINSTGFVSNVVLNAELVKPISTTSACCNNDFRSIDDNVFTFIVNNYALANAVLYNDILTFC